MPGQGGSAADGPTQVEPVAWGSAEVAAEEAQPFPPPPQPDGSEQELLVITGMSGAGRSTAAHVLEDLGWYVVDNLPPLLMASLAELTGRATPVVHRLAVVVDVRGRSFFSDLQQALEAAELRGTATRLLFLDATDETLVRRFESVRRPHPLQVDGTVLDGIRRERSLLADLRGTADTVLDTSRLNVHELSMKIREAFGDLDGPSMRLTLMSFGFKYGLPLDADHVADVRFLPNPFWVPELRPLTGRDAAVSRYVLAQEGADDFLTRYASALQPVLAGYVRENKRYATLAIGCTGGKHRSVALVEELANRLRSPGVAVNTLHRDLGQE
jgi:RNase adapter protein RapZ